MTKPAYSLEEALLTQKELCRRLKFTRRTILERIKDGTIPYVLVGKTKRFYWPDVIAKLRAPAANSEEA